MTPVLSDAEYFCGEITPAAARLYARIPERAPEFAFAGMVRGPHSAYASTLAANVPLAPVRSAGGGASNLWEAVVPDPCCWSPEQPFLYELRFEWRRAGVAEESFSTPCGFRPLGVANGRLSYAGKPYRLLACRRSAASNASWQEWHAAGMAMIVSQADDVTCRTASEAGVWLVVEPSADQPIESQLVRLARWPAVAAVLLGSNILSVKTPRNVILAHDERADSAAEFLNVVRLSEEGPLPEVSHELAAGTLFCQAPAAQAIGLAAARERCLAVARRLEYAGLHETSGIFV